MGFTELEVVAVPEPGGVGKGERPYTYSQEDSVPFGVQLRLAVVLVIEPAVKAYGEGHDGAAVIVTV